ncbi:MAG: hypothetical protein U0Z70_18415 [Thermomicrobiales bacterium]
MDKGWGEVVFTLLAALAVMAFALLLFLVGGITVIHGVLWGWLVLLVACGCVALAVLIVCNLFPARE